MNSPFLERSCVYGRLYCAIWPLAALLYFMPGIPSTVASPTEISGRVVGVIDGDTIEVLFPGNSLSRIRLAEIDAPEKNQPWGRRAKRGLSALVFGKTVRVVRQGQDRYGRTIGQIRVSDTYVNKEMVKSGLAWAYRRYLSDRSLLNDEDQARAGKIGLWSDNPANIVPPWEWRNSVAQPSVRRVGKPVTIPISKWQCGTKCACRQMGSCEEAKFYAFKCGVRSLDGDGDRVPCEKLCRQSR